MQLNQKCSSSFNLNNKMHPFMNSSSFNHNDKMNDQMNYAEHQKLQIKPDLVRNFPPNSTKQM
jgi:hypothetical protein